MVEWTVARPKNTHICKPPFACQNVLKLTYSNLEFQNFPGTPGLPSSRGGEGRGREGKGKGRREGKDREGRGGTGEGTREGGEEWGRWGGEERGGALDMGSAPPRDKLWIRPCMALYKCALID